ncbi:calcium binding EGF domain-containing protein [Aphelenchoides avenae]|nr:calcium binding EGF domain-containing protein [Aphelenchus avenae]
MPRFSTLLYVTSLNGFLSASLIDGSLACSNGLPPPIIYATHSNTFTGTSSGIHYIYNGTERTLISMDGSIAAFDFSHDGKVIAWSDNQRNLVHICRVSETETLLDGMSRCNGSENEFVEHEQGSVSGLAIDWVHSLLFQTLRPFEDVRDEGQIRVVDLRTMRARVLIDTDVHAPQALAVDPSMGVIFWTDVVVGRVYRSGIDGGQRVTLPESYGHYRIHVPNGLALDMAERRVYWLESGNRQGIYSTDYDGANFRADLRTDLMSHPFSLSITPDSFIWGDWDRGAVYASSRCSNKTVQLGKAPKRERSPMTVRVFGPSTQPEFENVCKAHTCGCDDFCLPTSRLEIAGSDSDGEQLAVHLYVCLTEKGTRVLPMPPAQATQYGAWTAVSTILNVLLVLALIALLVCGTPAPLQRRIVSFPYGLLRNDAESGRFELRERAN